MKIIGHRGAGGLAPENTLRSFQKALEHNVDEVELDLRVTADQQVVIHHDPAVRDPSGAKLLIRTHTLPELLQHKSDLLTFQAFIDSFGAPVHLLIEIKRREPVKPIITLLQHAFRHKLKPGDLSITSFDFTILSSMHAAFPTVEMIVNESWSGVRGSYRARRLGTHRLNMRATWLWIGFLKSMHRSGYQIAPYTIHNPERTRKWKPYLYGVITDRPDLFEKRT